MQIIYNWYNNCYFLNITYTSINVRHYIAGECHPVIFINRGWPYGTSS